MDPVQSSVYSLCIEEADIQGRGVSHHNLLESISLDIDRHMVTNLGTNSTITFTIAEKISGIFDIYITVSKCLCSGSSAPFGFSINGAPPFAFPLAYQVSGDSPFAYHDDGVYDVGHVTDTGRFLVQSNVELNEGDTLTIVAMYGCCEPGLAGAVFPDVGDMLLVPAGVNVATGYYNTIEPIQLVDPQDPISGKHIIWLGSSVTYGAHAGGYYSMVDEIAVRHAATVCQKFAISGTTLVNWGNDSYVSRLKTISPTLPCDLFVLQLSTNDATTYKPIGKISDSFDPCSFDDKTVLGALETIICHVKDVYRCPIVVYTGTYFESREYEEMVDALLQLKTKWEFEVLDLFHDSNMKAIYNSDLYHSYMHDPIHPFRRGYVEWWTPAFEAEFIRIFTQSAKKEKNQ